MHALTVACGAENRVRPWAVAQSRLASAASSRALTPCAYSVRLLFALLPVTRAPGARRRLDGVTTHVKGVADFSLAPTLSRFEQDLGASAGPCALLARVDEGL